MSTSKFWRVAAAGLIAVLLYLADGLHRSGPSEIPAMISSAQAGDVATISPPAPGASAFIVTPTDDGTSIRIWRVDAGQIGGVNVKDVGTYSSEVRE